MKRYSNRKKRMIKQKIAGLILILTGIIPLIIFKDITDLTYLVVLIPWGLLFIFTRECYWID